MLPPVTFSLGFVSVYVKFPNMSTYDLSPLQHQKGRKIPAEITIHIVWKSSPIINILLEFLTCGIFHQFLFYWNQAVFKYARDVEWDFFLWLSNTVEMATVKWTPTLMCLLILITFGHASEAAVTVKGWGCTHTTERYSPLFLLLHQQQQRWHDEISSILKVNDTPFSPPLKVKGVEKGCVTKCPMGSVF